MGRPLLSEEPKEVLIGAKFGQTEALQIELAARKAKQSKSELIRDRLLAPTPLENGPMIQHLHGAILQDQDSQTVSTGLAIVYTPLKRGDFFPSENAPGSVGSLPRLAATLKVSDGRIYKVKPDDEMMCQAHGPAHFHFDYELLTQ